MPILDDAKLALRIKNSAYDNEITALIEACKKDLSIAGVMVVDDSEAMTKQAIILYCKSHFGYGENSQKFGEAYESLKISMAVCSDFKGDPNV